MKALRILVVTNLYPTPERPFTSPFVKEQVDALRACYPDIVIDVLVIKGERPRWAYLKEMILLPAAVRRGQYDIVHAHFGLTLISTLFVRVPVVVTFHGSDLLMNPTKHISRLLAPTAASVIVVSQKLRDTLGYGEVIPCGIDVNNFALPVSDEDKQPRKNKGTLKVLFPSDPARPVKDYALFKAVCKELEARGNTVEEIHLVNVPRDKVNEIYWNADMMILTSLSEGSPTVIKEAIAAKLPFVSVNLGDVKEWADMVNFGVVVMDRDPKNLADAILALHHRITYRRVLDNEKCIDAMDAMTIAKRIKNVYDKVIRN